MKASVTIREEQQHKNPIFRAKIPVSVFGLPFTSAITARDPTDLSFSLRTSSTSGPSLKLSYNPNATNPFSISLKSGVGLFGSSNNSPLIMSANFNPLGNPNPTFCFQIKPQFGDFFLKKTALSASCSTSNDNDHSKESGSDPEGSFVWRDLSETHGSQDGVLSGVAVMGKTVLPVTKRAVVRFRWGVNFPSHSGGGYKKLPFLTVDKIGIERVEEEQKESKPKSSSCSDVGNLEMLPKSSSCRDVGNLEMLRGMCLWMSREVQVLQKENREMRNGLEEIRRTGVSLRNPHGESDNLGRRNPLTSPVETSSEFEKWRNKKNGNGEAGRRE